MNTTNPGERLAEFAVSTLSESIPEALQHKAKLSLLDALGIALASLAMNLQQ